MQPECKTGQRNVLSEMQVAGLGSSGDPVCSPVRDYWQEVRIIPVTAVWPHSPSLTWLLVPDAGPLTLLALLLLDHHHPGAVHHGARLGYLSLTRRHQGGGCNIIMRRTSEKCRLRDLPMTNASVEAMAMVRTMKKMATALQLPEQLPLRSLEKFAKPWEAGSLPPALTELSVLRLLWRVPDSCFNWVELLQGVKLQVRRSFLCPLSRA